MTKTNEEKDIILSDEEILEIAQNIFDNKRIDKDITSHCLRRSCATHYLQEGIPVAQVSRLLGHSNPQTTMRYYKADGADFDFLGL